MKILLSDIMNQQHMEELSDYYYEKWKNDNNKKSTDDILDNIPFDEIEKYIRKKKLKRIKNV